MPLVFVELPGIADCATGAFGLFDVARLAIKVIRPEPLCLPLSAHLSRAIFVIEHGSFFQVACATGVGTSFWPNKWILAAFRNS